MPNEITNRLILHGPVQEVERFKLTCIKPSNDYMEDGHFDFATLLPLPKGIPDDQTVAWQREFWGTKWNSWGLRNQSGRDEIDILFLTASAAPIGVFQALAKAFPTLEGGVYSGDAADDWCTDSELIGGLFLLGDEQPVDSEMAQTLDMPWDDEDDSDDEDEAGDDDDDDDFEAPIGFVAPLKHLLVTLSECRPDELAPAHADLCADVVKQGVDQKRVSEVISVLESLPLAFREAGLLRHLRAAAEREFSQAA